MAASIKTGQFAGAGTSSETGSTAQKSKAPGFSEARPYQRAGYIRPLRYQFFILTTVAD
jgi:hypothetical protein